MYPAIIDSKKQKIQGIINAYETGSIAGNYSDVSIFGDGPNRMRQITYGRSQTTEWGNLPALIKEYVNANGLYSEFFKPYLSKLGKVSLVSDKKLIAKLKEAGTDPIMKKVQDEFFDEHYWQPAMKFFSENGFTTPLSALVIYDSYIHSGGILQFLRNRFSARPPAKGGNEKEWIEQYLEVRKQWLEVHSNKILRNTAVRPRNMLVAVAKNDWDLSDKFIANGIPVP